MLHRKVSDNPSEFLDCLIELFTDLPDRATEEISEDLRAEGVEPDEIARKVQKLIDALKEEAVEALLTQSDEKKGSYTLQVYEMLLNRYVDEAGIQDDFIALLANATQSYKDKGLIEEYTESEKEKQVLLGKRLADLIGVASPEEVFIKFSELFKCAKWKIKSEGGAFLAENEECRVSNIFKKLCSAKPCEIYCLNFMEGIIKAVAPNFSFNVVETLWEGKMCKVKTSPLLSQ